MTYPLIAHPSSVELLTRSGSWDRLPDGRPQVPDEMLEDVSRVATLERAWSVLQRHGYTQQFAGGFYSTQPERPLVGRAVTAAFVPARPDFDSVVVEAGQRAGLESGIGGQNAWVLDLLRLGDVLVVDMFGRVDDGPFVGDLLTTTLAARTHAGAVIDGTIRDATGAERVPDVTILHRGSHPSFIKGVTLAGVNGPVRIGTATVLPGDVVLGGAHGVIFIPPHLVGEVIEHSSSILFRDRFAKTRIAEGRYGPGRIDRAEWDEEIESDFEQWSQSTQRASR